jgi:hypothetical protein
MENGKNGMENGNLNGKNIGENYAQYMHGIGMQQWGKGRRWKHGGREGK